MKSEQPPIVWSDYLSYRAGLRGFKLERIEKILRYSEERYFDTATNRMVAVGRHDERLIMIPYERSTDSITPVTVHTITRQQIKFRQKTGRFINE